MTPPINHHMTVTDRRGKQIRGKVVYVEPKKERWREDSAIVHFLTSDWLDAYPYEAIYVSPKQSVPGTYAVYGYASENEQWRFIGMFDRTQDDNVQLP